MNMKAETYKTIEKFPRYQISSYGRIIDTETGVARSTIATSSNASIVPGVCQIASNSGTSTSIRPILLYIQYFPEYISINKANDRRVAYHPDQISSDYFDDEELDKLLHNLFVYKDEKDDMLKSWRNIPSYPKYVMNKTGDVYSIMYINKHKPSEYYDAQGNKVIIISNSRLRMIDLYKATFPEHIGYTGLDDEDIEKLKLNLYEIEQYKQIPQFPNYEASNLGNIRNIKTKRVLKPFLTKTGHQLVCITTKHKDCDKTFSTSTLVARLVLSTWKPVNGKHSVRHIDGDNSNNNIRNLKWVYRTNKVIDTKHKLTRDNNIYLAKEIETKYSKIRINKLDTPDKYSYMSFDELKKICNNEEMYYDCLWTIYNFPYRKELAETWTLC